MGLTPEQFLDLTPAQFVALSKRRKLDVRDADYRAAKVAVILWNVYKADGTPRIKDSDLFPSLKELEKKRKNQGQSPEQMRQFMEQRFGFFRTP